MFIPAFRPITSVTPMEAQLRDRESPTQLFKMASILHIAPARLPAHPTKNLAFRLGKSRDQYPIIPMGTTTVKFRVEFSVERNFI